MTAILSKNNHRNLTFYGKILFIKQFVIYQAIHLATVLPCSKTQAGAIPRSFGKFVWTRRLENPPLNVLIPPHHLGGLSAILPFELFRSFFVRTLHKSLIHTEAQRGDCRLFGWLFR